MKYGFFEDGKGDKSSSRLIAILLIFFGIVVSVALLCVGIWIPTTDIINIATAIGIIFGSVVVPATTFLFFQKKNEIEQDKVATATTP